MLGNFILRDGDRPDGRILGVLVCQSLEHESNGYHSVVRVKARGAIDGKDARALLVERGYAHAPAHYTLQDTTYGTYSGKFRVTAFGNPEFNNGEAEIELESVGAVELISPHESKPSAQPQYTAPPEEGFQHTKWGYIRL